MAEIVPYPKQEIPSGVTGVVIIPRMYLEAIAKACSGFLFEDDPKKEEPKNG